MALLVLAALSVLRAAGPAQAQITSTGSVTSDDNKLTPPNPPAGTFNLAVTGRTIVGQKGLPGELTIKNGATLAQSAAALLAFASGTAASGSGTVTVDGGSWNVNAPQGSTGNNGISVGYAVSGAALLIIENSGQVTATWNISVGDDPVSSSDIRVTSGGELRA